MVVGTNVAISTALDLSTSTIVRVRQRFVEEEFEASLNYRRGGGSKQRRLDGEKEAHLLASACSEALQDENDGLCRCLSTKRWS